VVTNWVLFRHLITISGKRDVPIEIPAAIVRSGLLLLALINFYAIIYFAQIGDEKSGQAGFWICTARDVVRWFYFSTVTFSTLGYGDITPKENALAEIVASVEALNGLVAFGVFTGALTTYLSKNES
jgi:hypothetical protein